MPLLSNLTIAVLWLAAFSAPLAWWGRTVADRAFVTSLVLLTGTVVVVSWRAFTDRHRVLKRLRAYPSNRVWPLSVAIGALAMHLAAARWLDVDILSASLFGLGTYGLVGLYVPPHAWRRAAPVVLLAVGTLPFGDQLDVYAGFALRSVSAQAASNVLAWGGIENIRAETILILENGVAHVDIPCSGLRGLWTGSLFFLVASVLNGHPRRRGLLAWAAMGVSFIAVLLSINVLRIATITAIAVAADLPVLAKIVHEPLGIIGFVIAGILAWLLLSRGQPEEAPRPCASRRGPLAAIVLQLACVAAVFTYTRRPATSTSVAQAALTPPSEIFVKTIGLTSAEQDLFGRFGAAGATKFFASFEGRRAAVLFVDSRSWRAHHPPELCLSASGHAVGTMRDRKTEDHRRFRVVDLDDGQRTAIFWFQTAGRSTGHAFERIAQSAFEPNQRWVLVTAVVEGRTDGDDIFNTISSALAAQLDVPERTNS